MNMNSDCLIQGCARRSVTQDILTHCWWGGVGSLVFLAVMAHAADRSQCYLPRVSVPQTAETRAADHAISRAGVFPTAALGIDSDSQGGDADWWRYLALWRAHHDDPRSDAIRRWLGLPLGGEVQMTVRKGRSSPRFLPWKAASFAVVRTPHFEIFTRAGERDSKQVARDLERIYWVWTQLYFPLWDGRNQSAVSLSGWNSETTTADAFLSEHARSRLSLRQRHRVVLLPDEASYQQTISHSQVAAGSSSTIAASTGFYSDSLRTSFFYPLADRSAMAHEICHQLFEEATDRQRSAMTTRTTDEFWLVEGVAGHFESLQYGEGLASVGGWDSHRLQYARYQTLIARQPTLSIEELRGNLTEIQRRADLARWYSQSILQTHDALDSDPMSPRRAKILNLLAEIYRVDITDFASLRVTDDETPTGESPKTGGRVDRFLKIDDQDLIAHPITGNATAICLAGCEISNRGWDALPPLPQVQWFDASRTAITDASVQRLIGGARQLDQLSLEASKITPAIGRLIAEATDLRELDLSWTAIDDSVVESLEKCPLLETVWLTGTPITDEAVKVLAALPNLKTVDVQRTRLSEAGVQRLKTSRPDLEINPLQL